MKFLFLTFILSAFSFFTINLSNSENEEAGYCTASSPYGGSCSVQPQKGDRGLTCSGNIFYAECDCAGLKRANREVSASPEQIAANQELQHFLRNVLMTKKADKLSNVAVKLIASADAGDAVAYDAAVAEWQSTISELSKAEKVMILAWVAKKQK
ncbi:MAG: hypothetical protein WD077_10890 [Bacteroidia bacterium]